MEQGHTQGSFYYGVLFKARDNYTEAVKGFHEGTRNGSPESALFLSGGFETTDPKRQLLYFALAPDPERSKRYAKISDFLGRYEHLGAKVPDIDQIVPLPPAKLPEWDGTFEWLKKTRVHPTRQKALRRDDPDAQPGERPRPANRSAAKEMT